MFCFWFCFVVSGWFAPLGVNTGVLNWFNTLRRLRRPSHGVDSDVGVDYGEKEDEFVFREAREPFGELARQHSRKGFDVVRCARCFRGGVDFASGDCDRFGDVLSLGEYDLDIGQRRGSERRVEFGESVCDHSVVAEALVVVGHVVGFSTSASKPLQKLRRLVILSVE